MRFGLRQNNKVFCIGANKTGTTSLEKALKDLGFKMGDQGAAQGLIESYKRRNFAIFWKCLRFTSDFHKRTGGHK